MKKTILFCILLFAANAGTSAQEKVIVTGTLIAHRVSDFPTMTGDGSRIFVLRINDRATGRLKSGFIIVHVSGDINFPAELYDGKSVGKFTLKRSLQCDTSIAMFDKRAIESSQNQVKGLISVVPFPAFIVYLPNVKQEVPNKIILPCYRLETVFLDSIAARGNEYWVNLPSSPVRIDQTAKGTTLIAANYSQGKVTAYRLGWVTEANDKVIVNSVLPLYLADIEPMDLSNGFSHFVSLSHGLSSIEKVKEYSLINKTKLAIIEVNFSDGSIWKVSKGLQKPAR